MRSLFFILVPLVLSSCTPDPAESKSIGNGSGNVISNEDGNGSAMDLKSFAVKCENRAPEQYYAKPNFASKGFPNTAPYTEKYCYLTYKKQPWDGPYTAVNWRLGIELGSGSGPLPDGSTPQVTPTLNIYNLNATTIKKSAVLMGIMGYWTGSDNIVSFNVDVEIKQGNKSYLVPYIISPIDEDYVSIPEAPEESNICVDGVENICVGDGKGTFWGSLMPRTKTKGCPSVIPKFRVELSYCDNLSPAKSCPAATVYCANLGPSKISWMAKVQASDCSETAEYPVLSDTSCGG